MGKSLADLRAERFSARPERPQVVTVGKGQQYAVEIQRITAEHDEAVMEMRALEERLKAAEEREESRPRAMGEKTSPELDALRADLEATRARIREFRARLSDLTDAMADYEGEVTVTATRDDGDWARWKIAHPARGEDEPGYRDDLVVASGYCNSDDLIADLATYVTAWRGERLESGDFEALNLMRPDKKMLARAVVGLYESGDNLGELRRGLSALLKTDDFSSSPEHWGSQSDASSDGSPLSDTSTTTPTTA